MTDHIATELNHVFELHVPSQCICKEPLDEKLRTVVLNNVKKKFSNWFGGYYSQRVDGGWILPDGSLATEAIDIVRSNASNDAFNDHIDDVKRLAVSVADQLTQDAVFITVDGKGFTFARSNPQETRCSHSKLVRKVEDIALKASAHKLHSIYSSLACFDKLADAQNLFCRTLNYKYSQGQLPCANWPESIKNLMVRVPDVIADTNGFKIVFICLNREQLSRNAERTILRRIYRDNPLFVGLFVLSNVTQNQWELVNAKITGSKNENLLIRRIRVGKGERVRTAAERLSLVEIGEHEETLAANEIQKKHDSAFDVEAVTKEFYNRYRDIFDELKRDLQKQTKDTEFSHDYALQFLNRCMFIYFVQRKGWLSDDKEFMRTFWQKYKTSGQPKDSFFGKWLCVLFFEAFNNNFKGPYKQFNKEVETALRQAPFLNGGLFKRNDLDDRSDFFISDTRYDQIFSFLEQYNFTISEDSPLDQEVAVDPEMIGKVYESLVNVSEEIDERGEAGIFFTERTEIDLMCRLSLVDNLANTLGTQYKDLFYEFVFALEKEEKDIADQKLKKAGFVKQVREHLQSVKILDPACGSGSFLVGMLHILNDLIGRLDECIGFTETAFERKTKIIGNSLYGVDIMGWAVHVAELRLWLSLIVDAQLSSEDLQFKPLLPNLSFNIRQGDSLVQEVGDINLGHSASGLAYVSKTLHGKITDLKNEKLKYYSNDPSCLYKSSDQLKKEERHLFQDILNERINSIAEEIKRLQRNIEAAPPQQIRLDGIVEKEGHQTKLDAILLQKQQDALQEEMERIKQSLNTLINEKDLPFVWDIAFVEVFENNGFDIVIGNPPYVRQEYIADPSLPRDQVTTENKKIYKNKLIRSVYHAFPKFFDFNIAKNAAGRKLSAKNDLYIYFYFYGLSLLNQKGSFCFISSNSWLDVDYGKDLQEFLLRHSHVRMILDNRKRSFKNADVNTVIVLLSPPNVKRETGLDQQARFIMFTVPFEQALSPVFFEEIEIATERQITPEYRVFPISQKALLTDGWQWPEDTNDEQKNRYGLNVKGSKYGGNKWGGKYLRAPDIYWTILEKGKGKLVRLGDIADVRRGFTTGANEFFYLDAEKIHQWGIEEEFLRPVLKSPKECKSLCIDPKELKNNVFLCRKTKQELKGFAAFEYIKWGESQKYNRRPTFRSRPIWYDLGVRTLPTLFTGKGPWDRHFYCFNEEGLLNDQQIYGSYTTYDTKLLCAALNASYTSIFLELSGRSNFGEGILWLATYEVADLLVIKPELAQITAEFELLIKRPILSVFDEVKQSDRHAIDNIIFDVLGLTQGERDAVYEAVINLVEARLKKASSRN